MATKVKLDDKQKKLIKQIFDECRTESHTFRTYLVPMWRRNEAFWNNIQRAIETDDGKNFSTTMADLARVADLPVDSMELYERIINIYRAHGESFIAALSASLPNAVYTPDDADSPDDISTSKAYQKITQLIQLKEEAPLKFIKLLYHLYNHGLAFIYNSLELDNKYGVKKTPVIDYRTVVKNQSVCPDCGEPREEMDPMMDSQAQPSMGMGMDPMAVMMQNPQGMDPQGMMQDPAGMPQDPSQMPMPMMQDPSIMQPEMGMQSGQCLVCGSMNPPIDQEVLEDIPFISSIDESPKGHVRVSIFGPLHVTVQPHVKGLADTGYLILDTDLDKALVRSLFPKEDLTTAVSSNADERRLERIPSNTPYIEENNLSTISRFWLRPYMFYRLNNDADIKELQKKFKSGAYITFVNEQFLVEACDENMDDCWTATESALSEKIYAEPYGNIMVPIQEMTNDLISLTMETIESEIPINFFDPSMLDGKEFANRVARPGDFIPGKPRNGFSLDASIASTRPATLSKETGYVTGYLEKSAQFVLGTLPSVFGGQAQGGSDTLGEYKESRAQALQRLSLPYISAATAWVKAMKKASNEFINYLIEHDDDARYVQDLGNGNFINVWVKQVEVKGRVGDVTVENADQIPVSWNQKRTMLMDIINNSTQVPQLQAIINHPENVGEISNAFGLSNFFIPGDDDRNKQLREIKELIQGQPQQAPIDPMTGQPSGPDISSVPIDIGVDNDPVHIEVIKAFMVSEVGQTIKRDNPAGWANLNAHLTEHNQSFQMSQQPPAGTEPQEKQNEQTQ